MKKIISCLLIFALMILLINCNVYAFEENEEEYVVLPYIHLTDDNWDTSENIYTPEKTDSDVQGASYNKNTKTLTLNNLTSNKRLSIMNPGTDFTICVEGNNTLDGLNAYSMGGDDGQEIVGVYITGTGTLTINTEADSAITLGSYFGGSTLRIGTDVTLNLKSKKDVISVTMVTEKNGPTKRIKFDDESQNIKVSNSIHKAQIRKSINAYYPSTDASGKDYLGEQVTIDTDPNGIYTATFWWRDANGDEIHEEEGYTIEKWIWVDSIGYYIRDEDFERKEMTPDEFKKSKYQYVLDKDENHIWLENKTYLNWSSSEYLSQDKNGNKYVIIDSYEKVNDEYVSVKHAYDIHEIQELPGKYFLTKNTTVAVDTLEEITEEHVWEDVYDYAVESSELIVTPINGHVHNLVKVPAKAASCTEIGNNEYYKCTKCGKIFKDAKGNVKTTVETETIAKTEHKYSKTISKASLKEDGKIEEKCSNCGKVKATVTIAYPKKISLSKTTFTYNKNVQKPTITIKDSKGKKLKNGTDYTISYSNKNSKKVGEYTLKVSFKGNYKGSKKFTYKIIPKGTSLKKLTAGKKLFTATWYKQQTETTGYELQYSTSSSFKSRSKIININKNTTISTSAQKLIAKKKYYVRIRTYKNVNGKKIYSDWSTAKNVTTKR